MKIFSIDITALPLMYLPILFILLSVLAFYLYSKTKRRSDALYSGVMVILTLLSLMLFQAATGERLYFWSSGFHLATLLVMIAIAGRRLLLSNQKILEQWPIGAVLVLIVLSFFLKDILAGTIAGLTLIGYGLYLLYQSRIVSENEPILSIFLIITGLFSFIGQWFPFNGGRFLFSVMLIILMGTEIIRFFERVLGIMQAASLSSVTDGLTGLFNKRFLFNKVNQVINQTGIGIIFADIDNFKKLNDTKGHDVGDKVLIQVGQIMREVIGNKGYACRFGGEEIVGIVIHGNSNKLAENFRKKVEELTSVTVSVGVATNEDKTEAQALIKCADERMYQAKNSGKNKVVIN